MISSVAVKQLQADKKQIAAKIQTLQAAASKIDQAIATLSGAVGKTAAAPLTSKRKKMSPLGRLRIKLGSLNRYNKKEEAKKVQAQIAALEAKAKK